MEPSAPSLNRLIERLDSDWPLTRQAAMLQAASLPLEQMEQLLLMTAARQRHQHRRAWKYVVALLVCGAFLGLLIGAATHDSPELLKPLLAMLSVILLILLLPAAILPFKQYAHAAMRAVCIATKEPRFVGVALTRLHTLKQYTTLKEDTCLKMANTSEALIAMLRNISATNAPVLTSEQHAFLLTLLGQDVELTRAAIHALPYIGRESAFPFVVKIGDNPNMPLDIRYAAETCSTQLLERLAETRQAKSLLRASSRAEVATPDVLLRPAAAQPAAPPEQLLRAAVREE